MTHPQTQDDEALVEQVAIDMYRSQPDPYGPAEPTLDDWHERLDDNNRACWRELSQIALTALRNHEGRK